MMSIAIFSPPMQSASEPLYSSSKQSKGLSQSREALLCQRGTDPHSHHLCPILTFKAVKTIESFMLQRHATAALALLTSAGGPCQRAPPESSLQPSTGLCCGGGRLGPCRSCLGSCAYVLKPVPMPSSPAFCAHAARLLACSVAPFYVVT